MDFINGCTTNVHVLDNLTATPFIQYTPITPGSSNGLWDNKDAQKLVAELRELKVLCTLNKQDIYLFGNGVDNVLGDDYTVAKKGTIEWRTDALRNLLIAIEAALTHTLAQADQLTHIAPWTWLYSERGTGHNGENAIVTLRVQEAPGGDGPVYILPQIMPSTWTPIEQSLTQRTGKAVLAPYGRSAILSAQEATGATGDSQWKQQVADTLHLKGISLDEDAEWADVELPDDDDCTPFLWPSRLCLVRRSAQPSDGPSLADPDGWQTWNDNGQGRSYRDPLVEAEEWFTGFAERKFRAAEDVVKTEGHSISSSTAAANDIGMATSPPFLQRTADQQAAMSGIYPTPPDGLTHQGQAQLGPQTGVSAATPSITQLVDPPTAPEVFTDTQDAGDDSLALDDYSMDEAEEDLFGDVGGTMFEENEVGDADFDYFDEPDEAPAADSTHEVIDVDTNGDPAQENEAGAFAENAADGTDMGIINPSREPESAVDHTSLPPPAENSTDATTAAQPEEQALENEKRALSPFGIRERLLPPPVPASVAHGSEGTRHLRRSSSFAPIVFRDGVDLGAKYAGMDISTSSDSAIALSGPSIALPPSRAHGEGDDSSDESDSSVIDDAEAELPPRMPWESTRKRKRGREMVDANIANPGGTWAQDNLGVVGESNESEQQRSLRKTMMDEILDVLPVLGVERLTKQTTLVPLQPKEEARELPSPTELYNLKRDDLIYIAQLVAEQASTCLVESSLNKPLETCNNFPMTMVTKALVDLVPSPLEPCDLSRLALIREPAPALRVNQRTPIPPRPGPELPDVFTLPPPFLRIQRNNEYWEMLPPALSFWEPNGLAAASGPKNVKARAVFPSNDDLRATMRGFMGALGRAYEGCKLGTHSYEVSDDGESDAGALAEEEGEVGSKIALLKGYATACVNVGRELALWCAGPGVGWEGTFVVYLLDPFTAGGWTGGKRYLCACFWMLFQSYLEALKSGGQSRSEESVPDVVLQLLPIELVAGMDRLVIPDPAILTNLAREVYDRCPAASTNDQDGDGAATPSILLAPPVPKRIAFQLLADVPAESLLQDGRVLHLAVAMSGDREWMSCVWSDGQGRTITQESFCLRGLTIPSVVRQTWQRTGELISRLRVIWRVFVALDEGVWRGKGLEKVWRDVVTSGRIGGTTVCVTLAKVQPEIRVRVMGDAIIGDGANGLATPASTPVAFSNGNGVATGTNSPNVGASDGFGAPLTPAGSESTISGAAAAMQVAENDPDAHLVEVEDESCGLLFKPQLSALAGMDGMTNGAVVRKGKDAIGGRGLLGVSLFWTLQVKAQGAGAVEIGSLRQAEVTLREVLRMYRALSVLTRARGLHEGEGGVLPVHLAVACKGAKGLEGFLS